MTERPILFSGEMVRAILAGRKTQTRRPIKPQPPCYSDHLRQWFGRPDWWLDQDGSDFSVRCPFGQPGDLLWVRECWAADCIHDGTAPNKIQPTLLNDRWYRADGESDEGRRGKWRPSIHMPKWAARIWLRVTDVRVERVQDITEDDARADVVDRREHFIRTWDEIYCGNGVYDPNGLGFTANPWVWALTFERCEAPARDVKCPQCYGHGETAWDDTRVVRCGACAGTGKVREGGR